MQLLDGKKTAQHYKVLLKKEVEELYAKYNKKPHLAAILVGNNIASATYVKSKQKNCKEIGFESTLHTLPDTTTELELLSLINNINNDNNINGILVQLPLPKHINETNIINAIAPQKDVDGFHPISLGKLVIGEKTFVPATPLGITMLLEHYNIDTQGKHCVVIGRSNIVGTPMSLLMSRNKKFANSTVTICHSRTQNISYYTQQADILIAAIGKAKFVTADMVKQNAVVIDVGINSIEDTNAERGYKLCGDVDFENVKDKCSTITPVPGGVGLMTIAGLMQNTMEAFKNSLGIV